MPTPKRVVPARASLPSERVDNRVDIFARTVPFVVERHYFGERKKASIGDVQTADTDKTLLSLSKRLLNSDEVRRIKLIDQNFRRYLNDTAAPFRPGFYLVPVALVESVFERATAWEAERGAAADAAATAYPSHVEAMRKPLGPMFNPRDYPPVTAFRAAYSVDWRFMNFGVPDQLKSFKTEIFRRESAKLERQAAEARTLIQQHLRASCLEITGHLADLLKKRPNGKLPQLRDGALDRLFGYLTTIEARDVVGDTSLKPVVARLRRIAQGLDLDTLREDADLRERTAEAMETVKSALDTLVEEGPSRGIRIREAS